MLEEGVGVLLKSCVVLVADFVELNDVAGIRAVVEERHPAAMQNVFRK